MTEVIVEGIKTCQALGSNRMALEEGVIGLKVRDAGYTDVQPNLCTTRRLKQV